jgi:hypothetical protein
MDKSVLIVELPKLSDEAVTSIYDFLQEITLAFESRYLHQLRRYQRGSFCHHDFNSSTEE